jgi:hypothetical protein
MPRLDVVESGHVATMLRGGLSLEMLDLLGGRLGSADRAERNVAREAVITTSPTEKSRTTAVVPTAAQHVRVGRVADRYDPNGQRHQAL